MGYHAPLSPSGFKANSLCPARYRLTKDLKSTTNVYAEQGTAAHEMLEQLLIGQLSLHNVGDTFEAENGYTLDKDDIGHVIDVHQHVSVKMAEMGSARLYAELQVDPMLTYNGESVSQGTADIIIINSKTKTLYVSDLKFGKGIAVEPKENYQLILYALGAFYRFKTIYDIKKVVVGILQPRAYHIDGGYRYWSFPTSQLIDKWQPMFHRTVQLVMGEPQAAIAGEEQCRWCGIKATCKAHAKRALAEACDVFSVVGDNTLAEVKQNVLRSPEELTDEQLLVVIQASKYVEGWLKAVKGYAALRLKEHNGIEGTKLVAGRASRKWNVEDDEMIDILSKVEGVKEADFLKKSIKSVAQMEKSVKRVISKAEWEALSRHIIKLPGAATLALSDDKRPAIASSVNEVFGVVGGDGDEGFLD